MNKLMTNRLDSGSSELLTQGVSSAKKGENTSGGMTSEH